MSKNKTIRILMFGASISAFRGPLKVASFQLEERLNSVGHPTQFFNCGVPGNNTSDGLARIQRDVLDLYPHVVLILFGTNDAAIDVSKGRTGPRINIDDYEKNIRTIIENLKRKNIRPLLIAPPPMVMTEFLKPIYDMPPYSEKGFNFMLRRYVERLKCVAATEDVGFVNLFDEFMEKIDGDERFLPELLPDGMHPNQAGQNIIAEAVWPELLSILSEDEVLDSSVDTIEFISPAPHTAFSADQDKGAHISMEFKTSQALTDAEFRWKPHDNKIKVYSDWEQVEISSRAETFTVVFHLPKCDWSSVQVRVKHKNAVVGVGKIDFLKVS